LTYPGREPGKRKGKEMALKLVEKFEAAKFAVFEHDTGRGVIALTGYKGSKNNAALFPDVSSALNTALAVAWGNKLSLTHRIKVSAIKEATN
jgi:hypothetical protein